jgi:hypothetical protein
VLNYLAALVVSHFVESAHTAVVSAFTDVESVVFGVVDAPPQEVKIVITATIVNSFFMFLFFVF